MIKKLITYPIAYLMVIVVIYSVYDYFEHIGRSGSTFEEHPGYWLLFSISAVLSFIIFVLLVKKIFQKIFNQKNLVLELTAIGIWLAFYMTFLGPLIDKLFWPFDDLYFSFRIGPFFIILIGCFIIRIVINLIMRKNVLYSK
ncbi:MAG: hypothetical protein BM563_09840 [Bacteroidetes bacterium MedPE-SWsnd-G1]|nr:MAG: hypothetical protein BM563_09840 [Bacteroidetes bacterium MedPE-SWsnd-G1]